MGEVKAVVAPSLRPSKAVEGGSAEFDGTIIDIYTGLNNYNGQQAIPGTGIIVLLRNDEAGPDAKPRFADFYSLGKSTINFPTLDGKTAIEVVDGDIAAVRGVGFVSARADKPFEGLFKNSNALKLLEAVVAAGFKETDMHVGGNENDVTYLLGQRFHFALQELPVFGGGDPSKKMLPVKYLGKDAAVVSAQPAAAQATATAGTDGFDAKAEATALVIDSLAAAEGNKLSKPALIPLVSAKFKDSAQKSAIVKLFMNPAFLQGIEGVKFDGKELSL